MTIKRRLFMSNILMYIIPILLIITVSLIMILIYNNFNGADAWHANRVSRRNFRGPITVFIILLTAVVATSWFLTRRIIRGILTSLNILSQGVHEIRDGNLSYRINYEVEDEFSAVCTDFNEMAERLYDMVDARQKDYQSRKELIAGISHDLRTPLTSIKAYVEGLEKGVASTPETQKKYLATIRTKTNDLEQIINQLFLFSKMDLGEFPLHMETVDIVEELRKFVAENDKEYRDKGLALTYKGVNETAYTKIDVSQFHNIIYNLLENSVKYNTDSSAKATILCRKEGHKVVITVADNGPGVDQNTLESLFDIFYRADMSRKNPNHGSGIGLAIARKTVERFGGAIRAENVPDGGLAIIITLPENMEAEDEKDIDC